MSAPASSPGAGGPDSPAPGEPPEPYRLSNPATGGLTWPDTAGGRLDVYPVIHAASADVPPHATVVLAEHEISLWDARAVASYLRELYTALRR